MFGKGSKIYSIITGKCPQCHKESMYQEKSILHFSKLLKMNEKCSNCELKYQIEPSFFYGAMYVSYAINVAIMIIVFLVCFFGFHAKFTATFTTIILVATALTPITVRLSRNIYINMFVSYNSKFN